MVDRRVSEARQSHVRKLAIQQEAEAAMPGVRVTIPAEVTVARRNLMWRPGTKAITVPTIVATEFAALAAAENPSSAVEAFASKWGALRLCAHGLPATHAPLRMAIGDMASTAPCALAYDGEKTFYMEPVAKWIEYSGQANALLQAVVACRNGQPVPDSAWDKLKTLFPTSAVIPARRTRSAREVTRAELEGGLVGRVASLEVRMFNSDQQAVAYAIRRWLDLGDVKLAFGWSAMEPDFGMVTTTLFGALAVSIAALAAHGTPMKWCVFGDHFYGRRKGEHVASRCCDRPDCNDKRLVANTAASANGTAKKRR